ncbi:hypothetical protein MMC11_008018 [Xylographa trunciseda]|nr:hypothetical protein [Xylographa trunciseda]
MAKPTIVLVPGAWHRPSINSAVMKSLSTHGYPTIGLSLPSAGAEPPNMDFTADVDGIRDCLTKLVVQEQKEVVLVVHSYTGMSGAEAPKGLGKKEREAQGLQGGVLRLVFILAFAMPEGFQPTAGGAQMAERMKVDFERGIVTVDPEDAKRIFYYDLSSAEGDEWASKLTHQSVGVYSSTTTYAAWRHIPSTYVIGEREKTTFTPQVVDFIINTAKQLEPSAFDVIERCDGGHCLMISYPQWLADVLRSAAGEVF